MSDTESTEMNDLLDKFEQEISNKFNLRIKELEDKNKILDKTNDFLVKSHYDLIDKIKNLKNENKSLQNEHLKYNRMKQEKIERDKMKEEMIYSEMREKIERRQRYIKMEQERIERRNQMEQERIEKKNQLEQERIEKKNQLEQEMIERDKMYIEDAESFDIVMDDFIFKDHDNRYLDFKDEDFDKLSEICSERIQNFYDFRII
jgi:hypothetical protein